CYLSVTLHTVCHHLLPLHSFPTRRSSDLRQIGQVGRLLRRRSEVDDRHGADAGVRAERHRERADLGELLREQHRSRLAETEPARSEEHTSELQSPDQLVCRLLLEKKKKHG